MTTVAELEDALSLPSEADIEFLRQLEGDILILGAAGKMGPSLARLCRRAADASGRARRILAVSRRLTAEAGIEAIPCDLLDREQVARLPECPNVLYLAGRKFGSSENPELTWAMNTVVPVHVAERFAGSRMVVFSTGNVYRCAPSRRAARANRPAGAGRRVCAKLPGTRARLRILLATPRPALRLLPPELRGGSALRRAGGYRAQGVCGRAGRASRSRRST